MLRAIDTRKQLVIAGIALVVIGILLKSLIELNFPNRYITDMPLNRAILAGRLTLIALGLYVLVKQKAFDAVLALVSCMVLLVLLEVAFRFYLFGTDSLSIEKMNSVRSFGVSGLTEPARHPELLYQFKPNADSYHKLAVFRTNSAGMRDKEYDIDKPPGVFRVAVVGDSYTQPAGVEIEDAYHSLIEERLNRQPDASRPDGMKFEFINFSGSGAFLKTYLAAIKHRIMAYDPDLVLVGFCSGNDHFIPPELDASWTYEPKPQYFPFWYESFAKRVLVNAAGGFVKQQLRNAGVLADDRPVYSDQQIAYMTQTFAEIHDVSTQTGVPVVIAYLSNRKRDEMLGPVADIVRRTGLPFVDTSTAFEGTALIDHAIYHPLDSHPNARANEMFADTIQAFLLDNGFLPQN